MLRCLVNGEKADQISISDRGLNYGDGCFETIAVKAGTPLLWQRHMDRLFASCAALGISPGFDAQTLEAEAKQIIPSDDDTVLKIVVTRGTGGQGYRPDSASKATRIVSVHSWRPRPPEYRTHGVHLRVCDTRLGRNARLAGIKHLNRLEQVLARAEWQDEYAEGLMLDTNDQVIEGTMSNVFVQQGEEIITPALEKSGVNGVMRAEIMEQLTQMGIGCKQAPVSVDMIYNADGLFICNSLIGVWPVVAVEQKNYPITELTKQIQHAIDSVIV
ncbi:MAG: hypothetical protein AMJ68_05980 [Acidithiobacillales bacterium SG8_45]|jgi:4-amino-4-deoxychorismate lyase|nr:MAG: hypothetical protein AMJ68_05980 [Acidithiobacillales bacterium SG8_45]